MAAIIGRRPSQQGSDLQHLIESQIVPRLVIADGLPGDSRDGRLGAAWEPTGDDVEEFARLLLEHDAGVASAYLGVLRSKGARAESLWLGLLAPTARHLSHLSTHGDLEPTRAMRAQERLREVIAAVERRPGADFDGGAFAESSGGR
jgi:hypothetical protein